MNLAATAIAHNVVSDNVSVAFGGLRPVRLCLIVLHTLAVYFYRRFYFGADLRLVYLLEAVLFGPAYSAPLCHPLYRGRSAARMIRVVGAGILNSLQVFTVAADAIVAGLAVMFGLLATAERRCLLAYELTPPCLACLPVIYAHE